MLTKPSWREARAESKSFGSDLFQPNPTSGTVLKRRYLKRGSNHQLLSGIAKSGNRGVEGRLERKEPWI
jgi:hypothetical protein